MHELWRNMKAMLEQTLQIGLHCWNQLAPFRDSENTECPSKGDALRLRLPPRRLIVQYEIAVAARRDSGAENACLSRAELRKLWRILRHAMQVNPTRCNSLA